MSKPELDDYALNDDMDDDADMDESDLLDESDDELDEEIAKTAGGKKGLLKRREIDDLLEQRRLERELRDDLDDLDDLDDFDDDFDDD